MAKRKVHWDPPGYRMPRARCGVWLETTRQLSRDFSRVTCLRCRKLAAERPPKPGPVRRRPRRSKRGAAGDQGGQLIELKIEPIRGRPIRVERNDGSIERGQLINTVQAGLQLCRHEDGRVLQMPWSDVRAFRFSDKPLSASEGAKEG
ncbi:MAG: hypothetical protein AAGC55_10650 [Myxococcota bacterium]